MTTITVEKLLDWGFDKEPVEPGRCCLYIYTDTDNEIYSTRLYFEFLDEKLWGDPDEPWYIALQDERTNFNFLLNYIKTTEQVREFYKLVTGIDLDDKR